MTPQERLEIELLPEERALLLKWTYPFLEEKAQLIKYASSKQVEILRISSFYLARLIGDLAYALVKKGCRDQAVIDLCERLEYIESTGRGDLADWYW